MRLMACAGAVALAVLGGLFISTPVIAEGGEQSETARPAAAISESDIARIKDALRLTPAQERLWSPFAAALRDVARKKAPADPEQGGIAHRAAGRAAAMAASAASYKRLAVAAAPLIKSFDETQRREALSLARAMGFAHLAAAF